MQLDSDQKTKITAKEFAAKFRSKTEVYKFVAIDVEAEMPKPECVTIYFLKAVVLGEKKCKFLSHY